MSMAQALSNAVSGLTATARGTETVAANLANVMTPGYARREVAVSAQTLGGNHGGVRVDGVVRVVSASLVAESRLANAAQSDASVRQAYFFGMENEIGLPGEPNALGTALIEFRNELSNAATRPDDEIRLGTLLFAASRLASRLNAASDAVQEARSVADASIATSIAELNSRLERVAYLNRHISAIQSKGDDASSLVDERQVVIDTIAEIVPIQEVQREAGKVSLFTANGAVLLDGSTPSVFQFTASGQMTPQLAVDGPAVGLVTMNGKELTASQMRLLEGGSLEAHFEIRDQLAPKLQDELDSLAQELHDRLADPAVDTTISPGAPGLFTDNGVWGDPANKLGLAQRISVNGAADPASGGELWRLRTGVAASSTGAVGYADQLNRYSDAIDLVATPPAASAFEGNASLTQRFAALESRLSTQRVQADGESAVRAGRAATISMRLMTDGVDSDAELEKLLQYEQAYAANARVIQAIEEMMDQILGL